MLIEGSLIAYTVFKKSLHKHKICSKFADPIFCLDEEVQAKEVSGERTRHYTADFDPTIADDDGFISTYLLFELVSLEFPKEVDNLHGGRAYSASNRFPPRIRHSGRSGLLLLK